MNNNALDLIQFQARHQLRAATNLPWITLNCAICLCSVYDGVFVFVANYKQRPHKRFKFDTTNTLFHYFSSNWLSRALIINVVHIKLHLSKCEKSQPKGDSLSNKIHKWLFHFEWHQICDNEIQWNSRDFMRMCDGLFAQNKHSVSWINICFYSWINWFLPSFFLLVNKHFYFISIRIWLTLHKLSAYNIPYRQQLNA